MAPKLPTELPGDKLRKAIEEFSSLLSTTDKSRNELLQLVSQKFDLSPRECDFLLRQLKQN